MKFLALLIISIFWISAAHAQYVWKITYDASWKIPPAKGTFIPLVASFGNSCTALDVVEDSANHYSYRILTSTDAARSWKIINPNLAWNGRLNHIQQINEQNAIIFWDAVIYLRTYNGGLSWDTSSIKSLGAIKSMSFNDSAHGMATIRGFDPIFITTDGGRSWDSTLTIPENLIYPMLDSNVEDRDYYGFSNGLQYGKDTLISFGSFLYESKIQDVYHPAFTSSIDSGKHWSEPTVYNNISGYPNTISSVAYDSVFCTGAFGHLLSSPDHGLHWDGDDSIQFDTKYGFANCQTISYTNGGLVGAFWVFNSLGSHHVLARREQLSAAVEQTYQSQLETKIFPNPAAAETTIITRIPSAVITIYNILGEAIRAVAASADGKALIDTRSLQNGTYSISINGLTSKESLLIISK